MQIIQSDFMYPYPGNQNLIVSVLSSPSPKSSVETLKNIWSSLLPKNLSFLYWALLTPIIVTHNHTDIMLYPCVTPALSPQSRGKQSSSRPRPGFLDRSRLRCWAAEMLPPTEFRQQLSVGQVISYPFTTTMKKNKCNKCTVLFW